MNCRRARNVALLIALLSSVGHVGALCVKGSVEIWPSPGRIPPNAMFVLEGHDDDRRVVESIAPCELVLVSGNEEVCLVPVQSYVGEFNVSQVTLRPKKPLTADATYALAVNSAGGREGKWAGVDVAPRGAPWASRKIAPSPIDPLVWTADLPHDRTSPTWLEAPRVIKATFTRYGCGPVVGARLSLRTQDASPTMAIVTIDDPVDGESQTYMVPIKNETAFVGRDECQGGFKLEPGESYRASMTLFDVAGNLAESSAKTVVFQIPRAKNDDL